MDEFKGFNKRNQKSNKSSLITRLVIKGYDSVRRDRGEGSGGGCIIFIKQGIQYRVLGKGTELEYAIIEIWTREGNIKIVNFYNPSNRLLIESMNKLVVHLGGKVICCGDFSAHGKCNDVSGMVVEELMEIRNLVCLNNRSDLVQNLQ